MHSKQQNQIGNWDCTFNNPAPFPWSIRVAKDDTIDLKYFHNIKVKMARKTYVLHQNNEHSMQICGHADPHFIFLHQQYKYAYTSKSFMLII